MGASDTNNHYHLKTSNSSSSNPNHHRHQSFPPNTGSSSGITAAVAAVASSPHHHGHHGQSVHHRTSGNGGYGPPSHRSTPTKSRTTPHLHQPDLGGESAAADDDGASAVGDQQPHIPLLYENVSIHAKDCNGSASAVPYENINLEYIAQLMREGYSKENVVAALGISRNNIDMACDILHEFVTKNGGGGGGG